MKSNKTKYYVKKNNLSFSSLSKKLHIYCYNQPDTPNQYLTINDLMNEIFETSVQKDKEKNFPDQQSIFALWRIIQ